MPAWTTFAIVVAVVTLVVLVLSQLTTRTVTPASELVSESPPPTDHAGGERTPRAESTQTAANGDESRRPAGERGTRADTEGVRSDETDSSNANTDADPEAYPSNVDPSDGVPSDAGRSEAGPERDGGRADFSPETEPRGAANRRPVPRSDVAGYVDATPVTTRALLVNVVLTQGFFAVVLVAAALYAGIPGAALGVDSTTAYALVGLAVGIPAGGILYVASEVGSGLAMRYDVDHSEALREMLAPQRPGEWVFLLVVVLPTIAIFEEVLFRAAMIGAMEAGFGIDVWVLAVGSSVLFAVGHGIQGTAGVVVTGVLGFVLAALFVLTESLLVVIVAHYVINALEFVVHEGFEFDWSERLFAG